MDNESFAFFSPQLLLDMKHRIFAAPGGGLVTYYLLCDLANAFHCHATFLKNHLSAKAKLCEGSVVCWKFSWGLSHAEGPITLLGLAHRITGFQVGFQGFQGFQNRLTGFQEF